MYVSTYGCTSSLKRRPAVRFEVQGQMVCQCGEQHSLLSDSSEQAKCKPLGPSSTAWKDVITTINRVEMIPVFPRIFTQGLQANWYDRRGSCIDKCWGSWCISVLLSPFTIIHNFTGLLAAVRSLQSDYMFKHFEIGVDFLTRQIGIASGRQCKVCAGCKLDCSFFERSETFCLKALA